LTFISPSFFASTLLAEQTPLRRLNAPPDEVSLLLLDLAVFAQVKGLFHLR